MRFYRPLGHVLARIPLRQDGSIRLTALLAGAGVFTRKQLRRAKPEVDGLQMSSSDVVSFAQDQVREIALHGYQFTVREDRAMTLAMHKPADVVTTHALERSEERRVGKAGRARWGAETPKEQSEGTQ